MDDKKDVFPSVYKYGKDKNGVYQVSVYNAEGEVNYITNSKIVNIKDCNNNFKLDEYDVENSAEDECLTDYDIEHVKNITKRLFNSDINYLEDFVTRFYNYYSGNKQ